VGTQPQKITAFAIPFEICRDLAYLVAMESFETIAEDFAFLDEWEERYKYIIDLGRHLSPLSDGEHEDANKVRGCASQVWLVFDPPKNGRLYFRGDSDAHIVKGLVAMMTALFSGKTFQEIIDLDPLAKLAEIDLTDHLTPQRANGLSSMIQRIKCEAKAQLDASMATEG
jgi:cysteine desulfuration protein SufE